jgi:hypothetical protein
MKKYDAEPPSSANGMKGRLLGSYLWTHRRAIERLCNDLNTNREKLRTSGGNTKSTYSINITEQRRLVHAVLDAIPPLHHQMIELAFFSG